MPIWRMRPASFQSRSVARCVRQSTRLCTCIRSSGRRAAGAAIRPSGACPRRGRGSTPWWRGKLGATAGGGQQFAGGGFGAAVHRRTVDHRPAGGEQRLQHTRQPRVFRGTGCEVEALIGAEADDRQGLPGGWDRPRLHRRRRRSTPAVRGCRGAGRDPAGCRRRKSARVIDVGESALSGRSIMPECCRHIPDCVKRLSSIPGPRLSLNVQRVHHESLSGVRWLYASASCVARNREENRNVENRLLHSANHRPRPGRSAVRRDDTGAGHGQGTPGDGGRDRGDGARHRRTGGRRRSARDGRAGRVPRHGSSRRCARTPTTTGRCRSATARPSRSPTSSR